MTARQRTFLAILLALVVALSGFGAGGAAALHAGATPGLTSVVICGDDGARTIVVDAEGNPVETDHEPSCCDGPCIACAGSADPVSVHANAATVHPSESQALRAPARLPTVTAVRRGVPQARAPPEDRS